MRYAMLYHPLRGTKYNGNGMINATFLVTDPERRAGEHTRR
jgi:hypothetical protein